MKRKGGGASIAIDSLPALLSSVRVLCSSLLQDSIVSLDVHDEETKALL